MFCRTDGVGVNPYGQPDRKYPFFTLLENFFNRVTSNGAQGVERVREMCKSEEKENKVVKKSKPQKTKARSRIYFDRRPTWFSSCFGIKNISNDLAVAMSHYSGLKYS